MEKPPAAEMKPVPEDVPVLSDLNDDDMADDENERAQQDEPPSITSRAARLAIGSLGWP